MHWGSGITDQDVEVLKKRYPDINWENQYDRERWRIGEKNAKNTRAKRRAEQRLRQKK